MYMRNCLEHNIREDLSVFNDDFEAIFIEISNATLSFTRDRQIGAGTGHRHGHSEKRRGYQDTPILQRRKYRKTRLDVKIRDLLLQKMPILKKKP